MPFVKGNSYRFGPKYTKEDLDVIREELKKETPIEQIFAIMYRRRPEISPVSIFRWIEKIQLEEN